MIVLQQYITITLYQQQAITQGVEDATKARSQCNACSFAMRHGYGLSPPPPLCLSVSSGCCFLPFVMAMAHCQHLFGASLPRGPAPQVLGLVNDANDLAAAQPLPSAALVGLAPARKAPVHFCEFYNDAVSPIFALTDSVMRYARGTTVQC